MLANGLVEVAPSLYRGRPRGIVAAGVEEPNALVQLGGSCSEGMLPATTVELYDGLSATTLSGMGPPRPDPRPRRLRQEVRAHRRPGRRRRTRRARGRRRCRRLRRPGDPRRRPAGARRFAALRCAERPHLGRRGPRGTRRRPRGRRTAPHHGLRRLRRQLRARPPAAHRPPRSGRPRSLRRHLTPAAVAHPGPPGGPGDRRARASAGLRRQRPARRDARRGRAHVPQPVCRGSGFAGRGEHDQRQRLRHGRRPARRRDRHRRRRGRAPRTVPPGRRGRRGDGCAGADGQRGGRHRGRAAGSPASPSRPSTPTVDSPAPPSRSTATCSPSRAAGARWCICTASARAGCAGTRTWSPSSPTAPYADQQVVGAARGTYDLDGCLAEGARAGALAATEAGFPVPVPPCGERRKSSGPVPARCGWSPAPDGEPGTWDTHFVDLQRDVTVADVWRSTGAGMRGVEHVKRYTSLGTANDQGKTSGVNAIGVIAEALGRLAGRDRHHGLPGALHAGGLRRPGRA